MELRVICRTESVKRLPKHTFVPARRNREPSSHSCAPTREQPARRSRKASSSLLAAARTACTPEREASSFLLAEARRRVEKLLTSSEFPVERVTANFFFREIRRELLEDADRTPPSYFVSLAPGLEVRRISAAPHNPFSTNVSVNRCAALL
jgi:hypothetical protein